MGHNENLKELWSIHRVIYVWSSKIFVVLRIISVDGQKRSSGLVIGANLNAIENWVPVRISGLDAYFCWYCFHNA